MSPFETLYRYASPRLLDYIPGTSNNVIVDQLLRNRTQIVNILKGNLTAAQARMKNYADKNRIEQQFMVREWVYLRLQPYQQKSVAARRNMKLEPHFYSPFRVAQRLGLVAYRLELPSTSQIHPVFHVSCLKKKIGDQIQPLATLPPTNGDDEVISEPEAMRDWHMRQQGGRVVTEVLIKWIGLSKEENSWENL
ncbi:uncharacterized protein LOC121247415 [Juglans microcarpa x Juglans regia]|uniref:uncharacterized protein LOC121247415 n=1 Tax=Juglans microcarpa x Juglans regia TaxID=2249226 RepID=UPI001B7EBFFF|nr:uncharacterized protein LOC121247415 [Juglans microcarpa x Juglans regia]